MLTNFQETKLTYLFGLLDYKKNGFIRKDDFIELAEKISTELNLDSEKSLAAKESSYSFFRQMVKDMDPNSLYEVHLESWLRFFDEEIVNSDDSDTLQEYAQLILGYVFGYFDDNRDGFLSSQEYSHMFKVLGMNDFELGKTFNNIDKNSDFRLSRYELLLIVETFLTSDDPTENGNLVFGKIQ